MKISWIKNKDDKQSFKLIESLGGAVYKLDDPEKVDKMIECLYEKEKEKYNTIIISKELSAFSGDIIKKYKSDDSVRIIIAP